MAKIIGENIVLNEEELKLIGKSTELELIPNKEGIFLLIDKNLNQSSESNILPKKEDVNEELENKLINKIKSKKLSELVEGKFEDTLSTKEVEILNKLLEEKRIIIFKLNESYKKGVYKVNEEEEKEKKFDSEVFTTDKKHAPDYTLEKDGFVATTNLERAKILSSEHKERIEDGELKGIKSFEGIYYLIDNDLLTNYMNKILNEFHNENKQELIELSEKVDASTELVKIVIEFLKEDGEIIERKKGNYQYIN
jgi:hypothetical protein